MFCPVSSVLSFGVNCTLENENTVRDGVAYFKAMKKIVLKTLPHRKVKEENFNIFGRAGLNAGLF